MREATFFTFDGISSEDMGVRVVNTDGALFEEIFLPRRSIVETQAANREKPYFQRVVNEPLSFPLTFFIYEWQKRDNLRQIARWLFQDYYKPLWFDTNPERIFYGIVEGDSTLLHNGLKEGYITLNIRCDSPYTYSPVQTVDTLESRASNTFNQFTIYNEGGLPTKPKLWITKRLGDGDVAVKNKSTNQTLTIKGLQNNEQVFIDCENEEIISDLQYLNVYHYDNHNDVWIELGVDESAENTLEFIGDFDIKLEYEMIYLAE